MTSLFAEMEETHVIGIFSNFGRIPSIKLYKIPIASILRTGIVLLCKNLLNEFFPNIFLPFLLF